jgi:hypothetical protein
LALPVAATLATQVSAQGHHRGYDRRARHYYPRRPSAYHPRAKYRYGYRHGYGPRGVRYHGRPYRYHRRYY